MVERTEWKYLKCSKYRRAGKHGCVNHVLIQYRDFCQCIIDLLIKKGESVTLKLQGNVERGQENKLKQLINVNEQKEKTLLGLSLEELINKEELKNGTDLT
ncbi:hypothetical protein CN388_27550 [Bacillus cereus]|uniref:Uncharacterized protein n=1 Tax=Bacillus cereus TaxID=1396 RepID=A0A9X6VML9_BACCE|nr:hypothetical protein CN388_27550 [Bacillus cereus]PFC10642.1 hypothetical protein CN284_20745 [Bacillus cereus]PFD23178.1 hypothetical protein CN263_08850 [Bacillus cereus]